MEKNIASQKWYVKAWDETNHTVKTGDAANITANLRIDGGAANAVDDTNPTELEDGYYVFDITQVESNGDYILICPSSATVNIQVEGCPKAFTTTAPNFNKLGIESDGDLTKLARPAATVVADGGNGASSFVTNLTESDDDYWANGPWGKFITGSLANQVRKILTYTALTHKLTFATPFTGTPSPGDILELIVE